ncbi:MAG: NAD(P)H-dependent flavin oxidoreductase [Actinomycetota bacterium]
MTSFTELIGCALPVQQAPMGGVTPPELVFEVARAGGLGTLNAFHQAAELSELLARADPTWPGAIAVNVLIPVLNMETLEIAASAARVVDFFWGDPDTDLVKRAHEGGALASWQVGSAERAKMAVDAGCDVVIAQGREAGGHHDGRQPLARVLDETLSSVDVPVLAAGGIGTAEDVRDALARGPAGVRCGTRFVATSESPVHPAYKQALVDARAGDAVESDRFRIGCPLCPSNHGVLRASVEAAERLGDSPITTFRTHDGREIDIPAFFSGPPMKSSTGHVEAMCMYAGRSVEGVRAVLPAADVVRELAGVAAPP